MKKVLVFLAAVSLLGLFIGCGKGVDVEGARGAIDGIKAGMEDLKKAEKVIHVKSDVIVFEEALSEEIRGMAETVHLSTHGLEYLFPYMDAVVDKLTAYREDPAKHRDEILVLCGKLSSLVEAFRDMVKTKEFVSLMELPYPEKAPHEISHMLLENESVQKIGKTKEASSLVHNAMHDLEDALKGMELKIKALIDALK